MNNRAVLSFQSDGTPYSEQFNEIYFDSESGYQQSENIFIHGNNITNRLQQSNDSFVIAETGFGTGLNFLLTLQAYRRLQVNFPNTNVAKLNFISVEKFPFSKAQLAKSLTALPQLKVFTELLLAQYPEFESTNEQVTEVNASFFDGKVSLKIIIADAAPGLSKIKTNNMGLVDAWYLDGFSPVKNPEMWSEQIFSEISRLSKDQASIATFTIAGFVKRHLQQIGFRVEEKFSNSNINQMLTGVFQQNPNTAKGYQLRPKITKPQHVSIIGGGIASACTAYALTKKGIKVTLYCKDKALAQGASSNAIGALYPLLHQKDDDISLFYQQAFWRARALYGEVTERGFDFPHSWCGLLEIAYKESIVKRQEKFTQLATWPTALIHQVGAEQASKIANITLTHGGLFMPNAGWIAPQPLVKQMINAANSTGKLTIKTDVLVHKIEQVQPIEEQAQNEKIHWRLATNQGTFDASVLVVCGGAEVIDADFIKQLPFSVVQGQVTSMQTNSSIKPLSTVICHKGYLTPINSNSQQQGIHCIGATFKKNNTSTIATKEDDKFNLAMLESCLPDLAKEINWTEQDISSSKARLRCMTPDHMPMVGAMPDIQQHLETYPHLAKDKNWQYKQAAPVVKNLYLMMGFGARGLCSAPLAADILTADLCGTLYPVDNNMLFNLSPNRFVIRDIIRRKI
ncbi:MAG: bifunctional tRNA (5-methylaminomethyl-2-thiouridine)(34)-methyltransferase MnmD/FAD-dependent 5-carboxymethylaminomethyl-2-thiouridine(34) oxidoreductase MnmC [Colwellia sp.]|nr:bifunctional tRNA (5-methylaminomethyl-2-thiouridine)(34)-methyltransferase MnmD/FAD-dependent 5-carboxymethylaminomethyl-2-thiouridine(34) oxidoreductase MnmC [Colwellia sp.]